MDVKVTDAKGRLTQLVRSAEAGEDVVLTRFGRAVVRLVPVAARPNAAARRQILEAVRSSGMVKVTSGAGAARSQDFLYDETGLPR
ncbi:MAG: type II toxin-antitoxin system prevent-host-death family antitoxin [Proteobacteria bacterium]|nr:type II toxin-antitoxin system prevent-host-death family antitoxin [Pseudomonadota bacterium]MBI3497313.1 type II toxin-antitoxin system prevent-host-death family antitoxin [Pseudomonadota bacterium]